MVEADQGDAIPVLREYVTQVPVTRPYFDADPGSPDEIVAAEISRHPVFLLTARVQAPTV